MFKVQTNKVPIGSQKRIAAAFLDLIQASAYEDISVTDICRRADVVRKTFYNNFQSKDDVVRYLIDDIFYRMESSMDLARMRLSEVLLGAFRFVIDNRDALLLFYHRGLLRFAHRSIADYITKSHIPASLNGAAVDARAYPYIAAQISAVLISVIETWIENGFAEPIEFLAELTESLMFKPAARSERGQAPAPDGGG